MTGLCLLAAAVGFGLREEEEASAESCRHKWVDGRGGREGEEQRKRRETTAAENEEDQEEAQVQRQGKQ